MAKPAPLSTPDGRYIVVRGRLWRTANPALSEAARSEFVAALMDARRELGEDVVPFHRFAALVKDQVSKLRDSGTAEVAFRVAVKDGKVNFTVRGLKGGGT